MSMDPTLSLAVSLSLAGLLGGSALHQLLGWDEWRGVVDNYRLLPARAAVYAAALLPGAEAATASVLVAGFPARYAGVAAAALLSIYGCAIAVNLARGRTQIDCGCFGTRRGQGIGWWMVARNALLAGVALTLLLPQSARPLTWVETGVVAVIVATLAFLYPVATVVLGTTEVGAAAQARR